MGWGWWIHKVSRNKSKARLTEKITEKENEQEITCLIFSLVAHSYIQQSYHRYSRHTFKKITNQKEERSEITQRYLKIVQMLQINVGKQNKTKQTMGKKKKIRKKALEIAET